MDRWLSTVVRVWTTFFLGAEQTAATSDGFLFSPEPVTILAAGSGRGAAGLSLTGTFLATGFRPARAAGGTATPFCKPPQRFRLEIHHQEIAFEHRKGGLVSVCTLDGSAWAFLKSWAPKLLVIGRLILLLQRTRQDSDQDKERKNEKQDGHSILALIFLPVKDLAVAWMTLPMSPSTFMFPTAPGRPTPAAAALSCLAGTV